MLSRDSIKKKGFTLFNALHSPFYREGGGEYISGVRGLEEN